jgi:hypothetical protein
MDEALMNPHGETTEIGMMVILQGMSDWNGLIEASRRAGFHAVQLPRKFPQDEFLLVTKHCCAGGDRAFDDEARLIILPHGEPHWVHELDEDEIEMIRAQATHALN